MKVEDIQVGHTYRGRDPRQPMRTAYAIRQDALTYMVYRYFDKHGVDHQSFMLLTGFARWAQSDVTEEK